MNGEPVLAPLQPAHVDPQAAVRLWRAVLEQAALDALADEKSALEWLEDAAAVDYVCDLAAVDAAVFRKWCRAHGLYTPSRED